jgi:hypothetical protein
MIENYFFRGMRFSWNPHGVGNLMYDGIVEASPPLPARPMTYQGVDVDLCTGPAETRRQRAIAQGLRLGFPINAIWLLYRPGRTTTVPLSSIDILTGFMSGCPIVTFTTARSLVAHVGTVANEPTINHKVKQTIRGILPNNAKGFDPSGVWTTNDRATLMQQIRSPSIPQVVALVTTTGDFYSLLIGKYPNQPDSYVIGGCVPVPPWDYNKLVTQLR